MIIKCETPDCNSAFQDRKYGMNMRVGNPLKEGGGFRCTVCNKEKTKSTMKGKNK